MVQNLGLYSYDPRVDPLDFCPIKKSNWNKALLLSDRYNYFYVNVNVYKLNNISENSVVTVFIIEVREASVAVPVRLSHSVADTRQCAASHYHTGVHRNLTVSNFYIKLIRENHKIFTNGKNDVTAYVYVAYSEMPNKIC